MEKVKKTTVAIMLLGFILIGFQTTVNAQWHRRSDELPGMVDDSALLTVAGVGAAGIIAGLLVKVPEPFIHFKGDKLSSLKQEQLVQVLSFPQPFMFKMDKGPRQFGVIEQLYLNRFSVRTLETQTVLEKNKISEMMDLKRAALRAKARRTKSGIAMLTIMAVNLAAASTVDDGAATLMNLGAAVGGVGAVYAFGYRSKEEKELQAWMVSDKNLFVQK